MVENKFNSLNLKLEHNFKAVVFLKFEFIKFIFEKRLF